MADASIRSAAGFVATRPIEAAAFLVLGAFVGVTILSQLAFGASNLRYLVAWLTGTSGVDWHPMATAYRAFEQNPNVRLYPTIFFEQRVKFQYPPSALLPHYLADVVDFELTHRRLRTVSWVFTLVQAAAVAGLFRVLATARTFSSRERAIGTVLAIAATMTFAPMQQAFWIGQLQAWLNALFALACLMIAADRRRAAGVLIGLVCLFKPQFALFAVWALLRRQWDFLIGFAVVFAAGQLAALAVFGLQNHIDYLSVLSFLSRHGEVYHVNQSVNGLLNRLLETGDSLAGLSPPWHGSAPPPFNVIVYAGTLATTIALIVLALRPRGQRRDASLADFCLAGLAFTMASPIAWEHHYGILPSILVLLLFAWTTEASESRRRGLLLLLGYVAVANFLPAANLLLRTPFNIAQSYVFFGALVLLYLLVVAERRASARPIAPPPAAAGR